MSTNGLNARGGVTIDTLTTSNTSSDWVPLGYFADPTAAVAILWAVGTFASGTVTFSIAYDDAGNGEIALSDTLTADGKIELTGYPMDLFVKAAVAGGSGSEDIAIVGL